jgi:nucleotide-binding universal stress UspA family protein
MLPKYQNILYATDLSENARAALSHGVSIARTYNAKIHLVHVLPNLAFDVREHVMATFGYASKVLGESLDKGKIKKVTAEVEAKISKRMKEFSAEELGDQPDPTGWLGGVEVVVGSSAVAEILKASERVNADLLVFGSHSKGLLKNTFLGSVAEKVLEKTERPALIVPLVE